MHFLLRTDEHGTILATFGNDQMSENLIFHLSTFEYFGVETIEYSMRDKRPKMETKLKKKGNPLIGD